MAAKTYKLDEYRKEARIEPFVLDVGESQVVIQPPTGESMLEIAETSIYDGRTLLRKICRDQFDAVWDIVKDEPAGVLLALLKDMGQHFKVANIAEAPGGPIALSR